RFHRLGVDGLVGWQTEALVELATLARIVDQDAFGDDDDVVHQLPRHDDAAVAVAANDVAGSHQYAAAGNRLVDARERDAAWDDRSAPRSRRDRRLLQDELVGIARVAVGDDAHSAASKHFHRGVPAPDA